MVKTLRTGLVYNQNIIDRQLYFDNPQTLTMSGPGSGQAVTTNEDYFSGERSLKITSTTPASGIIATPTSQSTIINTSGEHAFTLMIKKNHPGLEISGEIQILQNASPLNTQNWTLEDVDDGQWIRFVSDRTFNLNKSDNITFVFQLNGVTTGLSSISVFIDGFHFYIQDKQDVAPPIFNQDSILKEFIPTEIAGNISDNTAIQWIADSSGTLDGTAYEVGDLLITTRIAGTQKTKILSDFST